MGGSVVIFDKSSGANFTRGKKRMRGDIIRGPEIKKWNAFNGGNAYVSVDFANLISVASPVFGCYQPCRIQWPSLGTGAGARIGTRINFLGFRLKGWLTLAATQLKAIRWRLMLVRMDMPNGTYTFDAASYLGQFSNADTSIPSSFVQANYETFCRHNFYKKFKDVSNTVFKTKVIASGSLPATNEYKKFYTHLMGTYDGKQILLGSSTAYPGYIMGVHSSNVGYIPIDVTVKLNDTVDCVEDQRRYYIVLETDCGYGWNDEGVPNGTVAGFTANMYCRGYYTDD